jgi:hypothetical protein
MKAEGAEYVINDPDFKILRLKTHEAACHYGSGTKWCTAGRDSKGTFDHYAQQGDLYVIIAKNRKFQMHYESGQLMDEKDHH